ncbi:hypothetical protein OFR29_09015 [Brachyspira hyodysenteriae]|uniref:Uncharacterized protein n=1 Tax=Brachyspira hyodysenteriae ATCC 27164 TaxID=1266923 RepID=A0A3B6VRW3_BRAHO|nr:hypothetical protein [Brachyspira hyodysenteriae]ANN63568.1 hypothetical protein BHYOB78_06710 [Brachyspira hyodysenteriae ATCC 27164]AUJ50077.1 hypothetical protein BH718_01641 [Brachyspira hyodysenteriae]KLI18860.1 hypothetical protein SU45_00925 [Brachyspira hyodysenteriae]KLI19941.1 hypothetical protein SU46_05160 [Brachyspira hyodysenteriae]KLI21139.1 hypothetical protein SR30_13335 [Brachyspira hyodysenteriae]
MLKIIFIASAVSLFLFTDFEKIFIVILDTVFELIKSVFIIIFLIKRFLVTNISRFLYDIFIEPIIYIFGFLNKKNN